MVSPWTLSLFSKLVSFNISVCVMLSYFSHVWLFATSWTVICQASLAMGFSRQKYWCGVPFSSLGDLPDQGLTAGLLNCRQILYRLSQSTLPKFIPLCLLLVQIGANEFIHLAIQQTFIDYLPFADSVGTYWRSWRKINSLFGNTFPQRFSKKLLVLTKRKTFKL